MKHHSAIITDSTCDLPDPYLQQYEITMIPLTIIWGEEQFRDKVDLEPEAFYRRLAADPILPSTSQPTPEEVLQVLERVHQQGAEEILVMTLSSAMSGTYQSACRAAENMEIPVQVYDSRSNSMSLGWQVLAAARTREAGGDVQSMIEAADEVRKQLVYLISLDTLTFLHKGGRIGGASKFIGTLLHLKPLISVNHQSGQVEAERQSRTRKKALEDLYRDFFDRFPHPHDLRIAVLHNAALETAEALVERIREEYAPTELILSIVSPILGVHTGPGAVALCGYAP